MTQLRRNVWHRVLPEERLIFFDMNEMFLNVFYFFLLKVTKVQKFSGKKSIKKLQQLTLRNEIVGLGLKGHVLSIEFFCPM